MLRLVLTLLFAVPLAAAERRPVLLELFTSEGCSSCPPADLLLAQLDQEEPLAGVELISLAWHVDYWDRLGWKDRFGSPAHTRRQYAYARSLNWDQVYTPQAIVQGRQAVVGSEREKLLELIQAAPGARRLQVSLRQAHADELKVVVQGAWPSGAVQAALVEMDLSTNVQRGENKGAVLRHQAVVRAWQPELRPGKGAALEWDLSTAALKLESHRLRAVAWQQDTGLKVLAAGQSGVVDVHP